MPNHVHFIMAPSRPDGLRATFAEATRRYTHRINGRLGWTGHLWQGRFSSSVMDGRHLMAAIRYVALNPVWARLVTTAAAWPWSSAAAHVRGEGDGLVEMARVLDLTGDFASFLDAAADADAMPGPSQRLLHGTPRWSQALDRRAGSQGRQTPRSGQARPQTAES